MLMSIVRNLLVSAIIILVSLFLLKKLDKRACSWAKKGIRPFTFYVKLRNYFLDVTISGETVETQTAASIREDKVKLYVTEN